MKTKQFLEVRKIAKSFRSPNGKPDVPALSDITFSLDEGEYLCVLGKSGCGKSTLLSLIAGLLAPDSGEILCSGKAVVGSDRHRMLMFQDAALFPWLTVRGNVMYSLNLVPELSARERCSQADLFLEMVGLSDFANFRVHELSGGMRQRVALARALAPNPDILLMDEPFSALDAMTRERLYADMQRIWRETGKTVIMVTHNAREASCIGSRAMVLTERGRIAADRPINLPYPREMNDDALARTAADISKSLNVH